MGAAAVYYGGGRHIATLKPSQVTHVIKLTVISFVPGVTSFVAPKFAVVILLAKLLNPSRIHLVCMWVMSVVYLLLTVGMLTINFAQCTPAAAQWGEAEGTCWDRRITVDYALTVGIVSVLLDFYLAIYPTVVLWQLQMNWKKKLAISSSLGFGYWRVPPSNHHVCRPCSDMDDSKQRRRCYHLQMHHVRGSHRFAGFHLRPWDARALDKVRLSGSPPITLLEPADNHSTSIEANCVLIGACIPTLFPLAKKLFGAGILGGSKPTGTSGMGGRAGASTNPIATIGSFPTGGKGRKGKRTMSQFDDIDEEQNKYIILEERSFHCSTSGLRAEDRILEEQAQATKADGW